MVTGVQTCALPISSIAFTEDTAARYESYGWDVRTVDWTQGGSAYLEDVAALKAEIL